MKLNLFAGGRRLADVLEMCAALCFVVSAWGDKSLTVWHWFGAVFCLFLFEVFTRLLGWVVRGFLGIPSGMDFKPSEQG